MGVKTIACNPKIKEIYADILCQEFSPCGNFLVAGSIFGDLHVFDLRTSLNPPEDDVESTRKPSLKFTTGNDRAACSLASTEKFLIVGSLGKIFGYDWKAITAGKTPKVSWCLDLPDLKQELELVEANAISVADGSNIYVGCGDQKIHVFSLEDGHLIKSLSGHDGYIHDLCQFDTNQLASAGEDGTVRLWDLRMSTAREIVEPYKQTTLERTSLGKWVGSVYVDKEWLVCGGGVRAGLWHLPTMQLTSTFLTEDSDIHVVMLNEERVFVGDQKKLSQFNLVGESLCSIPSSSNTLLSLAYRESPHSVLSISGTSNSLDICTNLNCRDQVLVCC